MKLHSQILDILKGKTYPVGTVRTWKDGKKYRKTSDGWTPVKSRKKQSSTNSKKKTKKTSKEQPQKSSNSKYSDPMWQNEYVQEYLKLSKGAKYRTSPSKVNRIQRMKELFKKRTGMDIDINNTHKTIMIGLYKNYKERFLSAIKNYRKVSSNVDSEKVAHERKEFKAKMRKLNAIHPLRQKQSDYQFMIDISSKKLADSYRMYNMFGDFLAEMTNRRDSIKGIKILKKHGILKVNKEPEMLTMKEIDNITEKLWEKRAKLKKDKDEFDRIYNQRFFSEEDSYNEAKKAALGIIAVLGCKELTFKNTKVADIELIRYQSAVGNKDFLNNDHFKEIEEVLKQADKDIKSKNFTVDMGA